MPNWIIEAAETASRIIALEKQRMIENNPKMQRDLEARIFNLKQYMTDCVEKAGDDE